MRSVTRNGTEEAKVGTGGMRVHASALLGAEVWRAWGCLSWSWGRGR